MSIKICKRAVQTYLSVSNAMYANLMFIQTDRTLSLAQALDNMGTASDDRRVRELISALGIVQSEYIGSKYFTCSRQNLLDGKYFLNFMQTQGSFIPVKSGAPNYCLLFESANTYYFSAGTWADSSSGDPFQGADRSHVYLLSVGDEHSDADIRILGGVAQQGVEMNFSNLHVDTSTLRQA